MHAYQERHNRSPGHHDEKCESPYRHANPVADRFLVPARGVAFDSKDTTRKGFVITISKEEGNRRTKNEYEGSTRHLNHDSRVQTFRPGRRLHGSTISQRILGYLAAVSFTPIS